MACAPGCPTLQMTADKDEHTNLFLSGSGNLLLFTAKLERVARGAAHHRFNELYGAFQAVHLELEVYWPPKVAGHGKGETVRSSIFCSLKEADVCDAE